MLFSKVFSAEGKQRKVSLYVELLDRADEEPCETSIGELLRREAGAVEGVFELIPQGRGVDEFRGHGVLNLNKKQLDIFIMDSKQLDQFHKTTGFFCNKS